MHKSLGGPAKDSYFFRKEKYSFNFINIMIMVGNMPHFQTGTRISFESLARSGKEEFYVGPRLPTRENHV